MSDDAWVNTTSPLTVIFHATDNPVAAKVLGSYTPAVNDKVAVQKHGSTLVILGKVN